MLATLAPLARFYRNIIIKMLLLSTGKLFPEQFGKIIGKTMMKKKNRII